MPLMQTVTYPGLVLFFFSLLGHSRITAWTSNYVMYFEDINQKNNMDNKRRMRQRRRPSSSIDAMCPGYKLTTSTCWRGILNSSRRLC